VRSAADIGLPMVAVSLVSRAGYFRQEFDDQGRQVERAAAWDPGHLSLPLDAKLAMHWWRAWHPTSLICQR